MLCMPRLSIKRKGALAGALSREESPNAIPLLLETRKGKVISPLSWMTLMMPGILRLLSRIRVCGLWG